MSSNAFAFGDVNTSLWHESLGQRASLGLVGTPPREVDVAIVGGGFTGLWTAHYLTRLDPNVRVAIFEANHVAFGASGRNGGWVLGTMDGQASYMKGLPAPEQQSAVACMASAVEEIGGVLAQEGIECGFHKGGMIRVASRNARQSYVLEKYRQQIAAENADENAAADLNASEAHAIVAARNTIGGVYYPHCAVLNPAQLAYGLGAAIRGAGVAIYERCPVRDIHVDGVVTDHGKTRAKRIVPAIEGYAGSLAPMRDRILPVYSYVVATEPLSDNVRRAIGLDDRQAFSDCSGVASYGQVTSDNRVVFGATASYPFAGRLDRSNEAQSARHFAMVERLLVDLFPQLDQTQITHRWRGALGVPRDFRPAIVEDTASGLIWGGGYSGRGVACSNLFGRTIAELIVGKVTPRTTCPWVFRGASLAERLRSWEPEPVRWIGAASKIVPEQIAEAAILDPRLPEWMRRGVGGAARFIGKWS